MQTETKQEFFNIEENQYKITLYEKKKYSKMPTGYGIVQTEIMKLKDISIQAKAIYCLLASYTGSKEYCFPSIKTISDDLQISEKLVYKYMKELKNKGLIVVSKLFNDMRNNHKYEVCYIEPVENGSNQPVENGNVGSGQNRQFINNNNINNNKIINTCFDVSNETQSEVVNDSISEKKQVKKKKKDNEKVIYTLNNKQYTHRELQELYNQKYSKYCNNEKVIWDERQGICFSNFLKRYTSYRTDVTPDFMFDQCFYALKQKWKYYQNGWWVTAPTPKEIILNINDIVRL